MAKAAKRLDLLEEFCQPLKETGSDLIYYVYALIDPRSGVPFYIGKGKNRRYAQHMREWRAGRVINQAKHDRIGAIVGAGYEIQIDFIAEGLTEIAAYALEREQIANLRATLTNGVSGILGRSVDERANALKMLTEAISRLRRPRAWKWHFLEIEGKLPTEADWELYLTIYKQHLDLRDMLVAAAEKRDGKEEKAEAT